MEPYEPTGLAYVLVDVVNSSGCEIERIVIERLTVGTLKVTITPHGERPFQPEFFTQSNSG